MPQIVWTATVDGAVDYLNCRWTSFSGASVADGLGSGWTAAIHPDDRAGVLAQWEAATASGDDFDVEYRLRRRDGAYRWMLTRAVATRSRHGRIVKWFGTTIDVQTQRRREWTLQCLDAAAAALAGSRDVDSVLLETARCAAHWIADWAAVYVYRLDGSFDVGAVVHRDPAKTSLAAEFANDSRRGFDATMLAVFAAGRALLVPTIDLDAIRETGRPDPLRLSELVAQLDICATVCVPLRVADADWGVLQLVTTSSGQLLSDEDLPTIDLLAKRVSFALDNALRIETQQRESQSLNFLASAGERLTSSLDLQATLDVLLSLVVPKLADVAIVNLLDDDSGRLVVRAAQAADSEDADLVALLIGKSYVRQTGVGGSASVVANGRPTFITAFDDEVIRDLVEGRFLALVRELDPQSAILAPLAAQGRTIGSLAMIRSRSDPYRPADIALVEELARRASIAIANARQYQMEQRVSDSFQDASLPTGLPTVAGMSFEAWYQCGTHQARVGGDWYDAVRIPDGRVIISVGDVAGSGLTAAVTMAAVRHIIRGVAYANPDPAVILNAADKTLRAEYPDTFVTAFVSVLDPVTMQITSASAGHPAALMLGASDDVTILAEPGLPLGIRGRTEPAAVTLDVRDDALLLFFTDGLIESTHDVCEGERRLHETLHRAKLPSTGIAKAIYDAVLFDGARDDVALLTVAIAPSAAPERRTAISHWSFDVADAGAARRARGEFIAMLEAKDWSIRDRAAAEIVWSEFIGNVYRYAPGTVDIAVDWSTPAPVLHVLDRGPGFLHRNALPAEPLSEFGRGLVLAATLSEELHVSRRSGGGSHARAVLARGESATELLPSIDALLGV